MNDEQAPVDPKQNLERPARKQVPGPVAHEHKQSAGTVNIWSGRQLGPRAERGSTTGRRQQPSQYRCRPQLDTGKTKGSQGNVGTWCTFFAKGMCYQGADCPYLHRLPHSADNAAVVRSMTDIFGREKMPAGMENKKGAGSYELDMTTLYVHYGGAGNYAVPQLRHLLLQNFGEFGPVKHIHIVPAKTIAFIRFHWRVTAEFAREAMDQQQLTGSTLHEVLSVRWAYDDPNPIAVVGRKRQALDAVESAAMSAWEALPPEEKRARIAMAHQARAQRVSGVACALPQPVLAAAGTGSSIPDDSFAAYRGFGSSQQQQQQVAGAGDGAAEDQQWAAAAAGWTEGQTDPQVAATAAWDAYGAQSTHQQQQQQSEQTGTDQASRVGSWFQGWRQRHKPDTFTDTYGAASAAGCEADVAQTAAGWEGAAADAPGMALLAGYGSDSESQDAAEDEG